MPRPLVRRLTGVVSAAAMAVSMIPGASALATGLRSADDGASVVGETWENPTTLDIKVKSPALGTTAPVKVFVPRGWSAGSSRSYPVVYTFHGGRGHFDDWATNTDLATTAARYKVMVVMPEGGWNGSYTNWFNYGHGGIPKWETFHTVELIQLMERNFHASTQRAAMGVSSGAEGAMTYAARHPGLYRFVGSYSGVLHLTMAGIPAMLMFTGLADGSYDPFAIWGVPGVNDANWQAHDPYLMAARLRHTGLFISAGTTGNPGPLDPTNLTPKDWLWYRMVGGVSEQMVGAASTSFVARLHQLHVAVTADIYGDGWHNWKYWDREYKRAWPLIMKAINAKPA